MNLLYQHGEYDLAHTLHVRGEKVHVFHFNFLKCVFCLSVMLLNGKV